MTHFERIKEQYPRDIPWQALPGVQDAVGSSKKSRTEDLPSKPHNVHHVLSLIEPPSRYMQTLPNQNCEKYYKSLAESV